MTAKIEEMGKVVETDVLVVGGGIAGAFAAIAAKDYPVAVTLVDKGTFGRSGCAALAAGVWHCYLPGDDFTLWYREYIESEVTLTDQRLLKKHIVETAKAMKMMDEWGVKWVKEKGKFARTKGTGDTVPRNAMMAEGGAQMMLANRNEALRRGVNVINKVMITDLLTADGKHPTKGKVVGAIGFHIQTGDVYIFKAKATILASGALVGLPYAKVGQPGGVRMPNNLTGDGYVMLFRAGAEMANMEFVLASASIKMRDFNCPPSMNLLFGLGAKFTNRLGERFMGKYDPVRKESAHRWVTSLAVAKENREGRGPITLDCTHFTSEQIRLCKDVIPIIMENLEKGGLDITKDKIVYVATSISAVSGGCGARTNENGETSIEGLYAGGSSTVTTLRSLPGCSISGWHAGENAAKYSLTATPADMGAEVTDQVEKLKADILAPLKVKDGNEFGEVHERLAKIVGDDIGIFLHEEMLKRVSEKLADVEKEIPGVRASDYHELTKVLGMRNLVKALELVVSAARRRTESREGFVREDYTETDNINWLKFVLLRREDDEVKFWEEPIPNEEELSVKRKKTRHMIFKEEGKQD
jgi:succinate dehydrogenase/fumarate reductase flavoprotein subunit